MQTAITLLTFVAGLLLGLAGFVGYIGHGDTAFLYADASLVSGCAAVLLVLIDSFLKFRRWFNRQYVRRAKVESPAAAQIVPVQTNLKFRFGVFWDADLNPLCPVCKTPLTLSTNKLFYVIDDDIPPPKPVPHCLKCNEVITLYDDDGNEITLKEAKRLLALENPNDPTRKQAARRLEGIRDNLPKGDVVDKLVDIFNQTLKEIESDTGQKVTQFSIPPAELWVQKLYIPPTPTIGRHRGEPARTEYSKERYCDRAVFLIALNNAISSLK